MKPSLVELLRARAAEVTDRPLYTFLANGEEEEGRLTAAELDARARAIGARLREAGLAGERALLLYPPGLDFIAAFWGCLYAGVVAVPAYPPRSSRPDPRLAAIAQDARPAAVLTGSALLGKLAGRQTLPAELGAAAWIATDEVLPEQSAGWRDPGAGPDTLAFLQYTSGSTSLPKGVMVTHGNLLHNEEMIRRAFRQSEESVVVGWLPLYHDMGLIGNVLQPLYAGASCILMPPLAFLQKPLRWLRAVSRYRATTSGGPNFAWELCVRKIPAEARAGLDLSSWTVAFSGAEPVRQETLDRFAEAFAPCGFRREAFYPCYGLAEATLFVTGGEPERGPAAAVFERSALERGEAVPVPGGDGDGRALVSCGRAWMGQEVRIVDPESGAELPAGRIGEIWIAGPSVARGYWGRPEETERTFGARLAGREGGFLRTGDLGFLSGGELFVAGRLKDLIILRGRNLYPEDVERTVERALPEARPGSSAAFAVEAEGEERLVVVFELDRRSKADPELVLDPVRRAVAEDCDAQVYELVAVSQSTVPKTSSGKVQRHACRAAWLQGTLEVEARSGPGGPGPETLLGLTREELLALDPEERPAALLDLLRNEAARAARLSPLSIDGLDPDAPLAGLDSLAALEVRNALESALGAAPALGSFLAGASLRQLAAETLRELEGGAAELPLTPAADPAAELPLSHGQEALWFLDRLAPESAAYNIAVAVRVEGELDPEALRQGLQTLTDLHPALRTTFHAEEGEPRQRVHPRMELDFQTLDTSGWSADRQREHLRAEAFRPFDLEAGPMLRVRVLAGSEDGPALLVAVHHLAADFGSLAVLAGQLAALLRGEAPAAPAVRYSDFVEWQRRRLAGPEGERLWQWWRERLAGPIPDLALPTDRPRPPVQSHRGDSVVLRLGAELAEGVLALARREGATLFSVLLAAFQALLHRHTDQEDLTVGSPASGRTRGELADLVGYLVNVVVLRGDFSDDLAFAEHLRRTRERVLGALEHQEYPFPLLAERLQPARDPSRSPLFQALFSLQRASQAGGGTLAGLAVEDAGAPAVLGGLTLVSIPLDRRPAQLDLALETAETGDGIAAVLRYNTDLFEAVTAERMLARFEVLLAGASASPETPVSALPLLTAVEQRQIVSELNATAAAPAWRELTVHEVVAAQAGRTPEAVAVEDDSGSLTYGELQRRASRLARHLLRNGIRPEEPVGICLERSSDMLVGLLGVLAAGGAYLPLDPAYPEDRLAHMLEDSGARTVLTYESLARRGPLPRFRGNVLRLDADWPEVERESSDRPGLPVTPRHLAYVIYTSGSTGKPKGVLLEHRGVLNFLGSMRREPGMTREDVLLSVTTLSFDIAALELFLPLVSGAKIILASRATAADGPRLAAAIERSRATVMQATPATWRLLEETGWQGSGGLRILCGGEALPRTLADRLLRHGGPVWNLYGPTETTIWSAVCRVAPGEGPVPLGRPIDNTRIYLLDRGLRPVPLGVAGELCIGGAGVARGYHGRPELTADRFVPDPFGAPGDRLYRTGDLARYPPSCVPDGALQFLGRTDHQVKVRGHRIELGEIESLLARHPAVRGAVVMAREDRPGDQRLVAYVLPSGPEPPDPAALRAFLRERLPEPAVPGAFVFLEAWPLTPNGKVDRRALPAPGATETPAAEPPRTGLEREIAEVWREVLGVERVGLRDNFFDLGGHSLLLARVQARLRETLGADLEMVDLLRYPTVRALADFLAGERGVRVAPARARRGRRPPGPGREIAIVAMAGRFPGAAGVEAFWRNLREGVESIVRFSDEELAAAGVDPDLLRDPAYVKAGAALDGVELFDAGFFGLAPREAEVLDPQHRIFLECSWEVLEAAGYDPERYPGAVGVYAGVGLNTYLLNNLRSHRELLEAAGGYPVFLGNDKDFVPTRVSYKLGLRGPSVNVQTACSSSLVAVHLARQALLLGECDMALAGGVSIAVPHRTGYLWQEGGIPSPDGHCRAFDAAARGTVRGHGAGVVLLKRLEDALADGDRIHAVLKGSAINNDGSAKIGYTAPSVDGQAEVIAAALADAGIEPDGVGYVEAHGTGTELGDPIEIAALTQAFRAGTDRRGFCAVGSVKTNIGHLDTAAGVAGLIKCALALERGELPPSLHFETPNPRIDFAASPFFVNASLRPWTAEAGPRRAGVSSFGIGGTNVHAVLEEAPPVEPSGPSRPAWLLPLSARSEAALDAMTRNLAAHLREHPELPLADVAWTLQVGRKAFPHRRVVVCESAEEVLAALEGAAPERVSSDTAGDDRIVAFLFPGQGAQHPDMGLGLYRTEPVFREQVDEACRLLQPHLGFDLREALYPAAGAEEESARRLERTALAQPALFVVEHALARLWMSWGMRPRALIGHSVGEWVAACLAGVFSLEDALALVAERGRLMEEMPEGAMLAVPLPEAEVLPLLGAGLSLAAVNGPAACTVSGPAEAIEELERRLASQGVEGRRLHVSHAFHSALMEPAVEPFTRRVAEAARQAPQIPFLSNVTGTWITPGQATDPGYWGRHLRGTVRFAAGLAELARDPGRVLLEVGPGQTLAALARQQGRTAIASMRHPREERSDLGTLLHGVGRLWLAGVAIDWEAFHAGERRRRVALPTYAFERQRHWVEPRKEEAVPKRPAGPDGWLWAPFWKQSPPPEALAPGPGERWLVFADELGLGACLAARLEAEGHEVTTLTAGDVDPRDPAAYDRLLEELGGLPPRIVHAWTLTPEGPLPDEPGALERMEGLAFHSLLLLAQAAGRRGTSGTARITVVSNDLHKIVGERAPRPEKALLLGPCRVIPQELPGVRCRSVDLSLAESDPEEAAGLVLLEARADSEDERVAWRGGERWVQSYEPVRLAPADPHPRLRERGVYLITGGLGGLGLTFAGWLADRVRARLVLVGRRPVEAADPRVQALEARGAEVLTAVADVTDGAALATAVAMARARFGAVHGAIHAAGLPGGGVIQLKAAASAERVLAPKVRGALELERALRGEPLDFVLLCSSINALAGGFGQVDYCAANAFLDAFARSRASRRGTFWAAVDWDRWRDVGMAAAAESPSQITETTEGIHPLLDRCLAATPERLVFTTELSPERHWVLSEHLILGRPTLPGTTYLEMAGAAFRQAAGAGSREIPVEIREAVFLTPLVVNPGERAEAMTVLEKEGDAFAFRVLSRPAGSTSDDGWREHARGRVGRPDEEGEPRRFDLGELRARCATDLAAAVAERGRGLEEFLRTGPRWRSLRSMTAGETESLVALELDAAFDAELAGFALHPSLLDVAAGSVQLRAEGSWLPLAYERIRVRAPLPRAFHGWARSRHEPGGDTLTCDLSLLDGEGRELVEISGFSMRRIGEDALAQLRGLAGSGASRSEAAFQKLIAGRYAEAGGGIPPGDGAEVLGRILAGPLHQVVVSTRDLRQVLEEARTLDSSRLLAELGSLAAAGPAPARSRGQTPFTPPGNEIEASIAAAWQRVLGIDEIGIHDNFFELGGTSLTGLQLVAEIKKALGTDVPSVAIFEAPTVSALAKRLAPREAAPAFQHSQERARRKTDALDRQRQQLMARRRGAR